MTDYHYVAERAFNKSRLPGSRFWLEYPPEGRDFFAAFARALEKDSTPPDTWCPDCEDRMDEMRDLEDENDDLYERIGELEQRLRRAEE